MLQHVKRLFNRLSAGKRAKVPAAVLLKAAGDIDPGPLFVEVYLQIGKGLIILEAYVVVGVVLLDEVKLHDKSFLLRGCNIKIDIGYAGDHTLYLGGKLMGGLEV
jgi:hypothetical protein